MFKRRIFTIDPEYFPPARMREIIDYLHKHDQRYGMFHMSVVSSTACDIMVSVLMTDPAVGYLPGQGYEPYDRGTGLDLWIKTPNGSPSLGVVWPGMFYQILPNLETGNTLKPIYIGVTVYPGKIFPYRNMYSFF
jgi:alpha-glucosidase